jgi:hypothetical protein
LGEWVLAGSFVVDTAGNRINLQVDHFSKFGTLGFLPPPDYGLFLPAILRNGP